MTLIKPRRTGPAVHLLVLSSIEKFEVTLFTACIVGFNIKNHVVCPQSYYGFHKKRRPVCGLITFNFRVS